MSASNKNISIIENKTASGVLSFNPEMFFGDELIQRTGALLEELETPLITRYETQVTHRVLNSWVKDQVISTNILETKKFTFVEFIWIKIVEQLRDLSISLSMVRDFKEHLLSPIKIKGLLTTTEKAQSILKTLKLDKEQKKQLLALIGLNKKDKEHSLTALHLLITDYIVKRKPISLGIFSDGSYLIIDKSKEGLYSEADRKRLHYGNYITVSLSEIIKNFLLSPLAENIIEKISIPFRAEHKALESINKGNCKSIIINFKNKKINPLEIKAGERAKDKLIDILFYSGETEISEIAITDKTGTVLKYDNLIKVIL